MTRTINVLTAILTITMMSVSGCKNNDDNKGITNENKGVTVTEVAVTPESASVAQGESQNFSVTVSGANDPAQTVTWSIDQFDKKVGTTINEEGTLTIAADENSEKTLTVRATSTVDNTKSGTATVTVTTSGSGLTPEKPVTGISLDTNKLSFLLGEDPYIFSQSPSSFPHYIPSDIILIAHITPEDATDTTIIWISSNTDIATVSNIGKVTLNTAIAGSTTITAKAGNQIATCDIIVYDVFSKESVIIDDVVWATRNIGNPETFVTNPEDIGMVYQFDRKKGWSSTDPMIASDGSTIWDNSYSQSSNWPAWTSIDDPSPIGWRVPSYEELQKLSAAPHKWTRINGIKGLKFGLDENSIFLPTGSWRNESGQLVSTTSDMGGDCGKYWSSTYYVDGYYYTNAARALSFIESGEGYHQENQFYFRASGIYIRCVAK